LPLALLFFLMMAATSAQDPSGHPLSLKGDSEICLRGTEPVMNKRTALFDRRDSLRLGAHRLFR
jgi:hypothetical protein